MARLLEAAQNEYFQVNAPVVTDYPFAMACWVKVPDVTTNYIPMWIGDTGATDFLTALFLRGGDGGDPVWAFSHTYDGPGVAWAETTAGYTANTWHHIAGMWLDKSVRRVYLNKGNNGGNQDTVGNMTAHNATSLGMARDSSPSDPVNGEMFDAVIYDFSDYPGIDLTAKANSWVESVLIPLAEGVSPRFFPLGRLAHWPMGGFDTHETDGGIASDITGDFDMAAFSDAVGPGVSDHPGGLIYPSPGLFVPRPPVITPNVYSVFESPIIYAG